MASLGQRPGAQPLPRKAQHPLGLLVDQILKTDSFFNSFNREHSS
jgi:hypothetical protein